MAPLFMLLCILVGVLGNFWLLSGMPAVKPDFVILAAFALATVYFMLGMPVFVAVLARKYQRDRTLTTNLAVSIVMLVAFYISVVLTWLLSTRGWELSFVQTIKAAGDSRTYGKFEDGAEHILIWLMLVSAFSTIVAGLVSALVRHLWLRSHRAKTQPA
jgi:hypothetical protein